MRLARVAFALLAATLLAAPAWADKVRIASEGDYPPFSYRTPEGALAGFDIDVALAACAKAGLDCEVLAQDFDGLIPGLLVHKFDAIASSMANTEERRRKVDFTDKYYETPSRFVARKGTAEDVSPAALAGKQLGAQRSTIQARYLQALYGPTSTVKLYDTAENADLDLIAGRVDLVLSDALELQLGFLATPDGQGFAFVGPELKDPKWFGDGIAIAVRKGDDALRQAFNRGIAAILADGSYEVLSKKYFGTSVY